MGTALLLMRTGVVVPSVDLRQTGPTLVVVVQEGRFLDFDCCFSRRLAGTLRVDSGTLPRKTWT